ncbi:MAG: DUF6677 family protein [Pirellulales bacterium]
MPSTDRPSEPKIQLRDPAFAALLAWLWPGAGHLYQGRTAKGAMFMVCILGTFATGFLLGEGRVVYASWKPDDLRLYYVAQVCVGGPALPALIERFRYTRNRAGYTPLFRHDWYAPPRQRRGPDSADELDELNYRMGRNFEFGTVYTAVAGLLNVLVIYDAWAGPAIIRKKEEDEPAAKDRDKEKAPPAE